MADNLRNNAEMLRRQNASTQRMANTAKNQANAQSKKYNAEKATYANGSSSKMNEFNSKNQSRLAGVITANKASQNLATAAISSNEAYKNARGSSNPLASARRQALAKATAAPIGQRYKPFS
jgi:hypothetical protein